MAAMAGHIDDLVAASDFLDSFDVMNADALVQLVPEPGQDDFEEADDGVGEIGGNFVGVPRGFPSRPGFVYVLFLHLTSYRFAYERCA